MNPKRFGMMGLLFIVIIMSETAWSDMKYLGCMTEKIYDIEIGPDNLLYLSMPAWLFVRNNDGTYSAIVGSQDDYFVDRNLDDINGKRAQDIAINIIDFDFDEKKIYFLRKKRRSNVSIYYKAELGYIDSEGLIHTVDIELPFIVDNDRNDAHILIKKKRIFLSGKVLDPDSGINKSAIYVLESDKILRKYIDIGLPSPSFDMEGDTIFTRKDHKTYARINKEGILSYINLPGDFDIYFIDYSDSFLALNDNGLITTRVLRQREMPYLSSNEIVYVGDSAIKISSIPKSFYYPHSAPNDFKFAYDEDNDILYVCLNGPPKNIRQYPVDLGALWKLENIEDLIKSAIPDWSVR